MNFGERLTSARKKSGLSRNEMANFLKLTPAAYSNYENGEREPKLGTLLKICDKLMISSDSLLGLNIDENLALETFEGAIEKRGYERLTESPVNLFDIYRGRDPIDTKRKNAAMLKNEVPIFGISTIFSDPILPKYVYFVKKDTKYDYIAFLVEDCASLGKKITNQSDNQKLDTALDEYIKNFRQGDTPYENWLSDAEKLHDLYEHIFDVYFWKNMIKSQEYVNSLSPDRFNEHPGERRKYWVTRKLIELDIRDLRKELLEKYSNYDDMDRLRDDYWKLRRAERR
jgi:transcriptional regulator with XRE-family HTH domain